MTIHETRYRWSSALGFGMICCGCSSHPMRPAVAPETTYLQASPIIERASSSVESGADEDSASGAAEPPLDTIGGPLLADGEDADEVEDRRRTPASRANPGAGREPGENAQSPVRGAPSSPTAVIAEANRVASQTPEPGGFLNAVMTYTFLPGAVFQVFTAPNNVTDLLLEPGEELMGDPAAGDTLRWRLGVGTSAVAGVPQKHIFIKPTRAGLETNLTLNTNRRTYFLKLSSVETEFMVAVQWSYPQTQTVAPVDTATTPPNKTESAAHPGDVMALNFDYAIEVVKGHPTWRPEVVYDDGAKTFIRFEPSLLHGESPALFVIERGERQLVNYRVKKNLYVVDRLFAVAELRLGQSEQDVVRLQKRHRASSP